MEEEGIFVTELGEALGKAEGLLKASECLQCSGKGGLKSGLSGFSHETQPVEPRHMGTSTQLELWNRQKEGAGRSQQHGCSEHQCWLFGD